VVRRIFSDILLVFGLKKVEKHCSMPLFPGITEESHSLAGLVTDFRTLEYEAGEPLNSTFA
jgi:hypothetical protein